MKVAIEWKPQDCWIGLFWKVGPPARRYSPNGDVYCLSRVDLWICLLPMIPIHFHWYKGSVPSEACA